MTSPAVSAPTLENSPPGPAPAGRVAGVLAASILLSPLSGYLVLGRLRRALGFAAGQVGVGLAVLAAVLGVVPWAFYALVGLALVLYLAGVIDAARLARRTPGRARRWALGLAIGIGAVTLVSLGQPLQKVAGALVSPSGTMRPGLTTGDHFFVDKRVRPLRRGEVVVFQVPPNLATTFVLRVKRAVALAGDTVELQGGTLLVNGVAVPAHLVASAGAPGSSDQRETWEETLDGRSYRVSQLPQHRRSSFAPFTVPAGHFFMLGDNRDENNDSRRYGTIPVEMVVGRALWIWWSRDPAAGVRWERFGQRL